MLHKYTLIYCIYICTIFSTNINANPIDCASIKSDNPDPNNLINSEYKTKILKEVEKLQDYLMDCAGNKKPYQLGFSLVNKMLFNDKIKTVEDYGRCIYMIILE